MPIDILSVTTLPNLVPQLLAGRLMVRSSPVGASRIAADRLLDVPEPLNVHL